MFQAALIFGDHMVIQRDKPVTVWGTAEAGETVVICMQGQRVSVCADDNGKWEAVCGPWQTSFEETMTLESGSEKLVFSDVQVGEVWLAGGQSNMEFHMRYDADMNEEKEICQNDQIRFF